MYTVRAMKMDMDSQRQIDIPWSVRAVVRESAIDEVSVFVVPVSLYPARFSHTMIAVTRKIPVYLTKHTHGGGPIGPCILFEAFPSIAMSAELSADR